MLRLFPLRRSFSLDLSPDDSNSNFLLHVNDETNDQPHIINTTTSPFIKLSLTTTSSGGVTSTTTATPSTSSSNRTISSSVATSSLPSLTTTVTTNPANDDSSHHNHHHHHHQHLTSNMSTAIGHWTVDEIDDALAADFDGSLSGLGIELGTASFNMSEALMALPSLSSLKHNHHSHHHHNHNHHQQQHHHGVNDHSSTNSHNRNASNNNANNNDNNDNVNNNNSNNNNSNNNNNNGNSTNNFLLTSSLATLRHGGDHNNLATSLEPRNNENNGPQQHINNNNNNNSNNNNSNNNNNNNINNNNNVDEKPIAVVHGKKNRLAAYGHDDDSISTSIKRFCLNNERETATNSNIHLLIPNNLICEDPHNHHHHHHHNQQCSEECLNHNGELCHLRHSSSVPDLRTGNLVINGGGSGANNAGSVGAIGSYSPTLQISHSAASSPSSSSISTPTTTFFSQIISSQCLSNSQDNNVSSGSGSSPTNSLVQHSPNNSGTANSCNAKSNEPSKFQYVLGASTSMAIKMNEETMTYLNQAQSYEIKLKKVGDLSEMKGKMLRTILRVCFHDRRLQYIEKELIEQWKEQRPSERVLEVDIPLSYGIHDVRNDLKYINQSEFYWDPTKETGVFIRINCISTEFTPKKHGGEKGVPFRILIETYSKDDQSHCLHAASCQVKVFKPKGADRKHKTDREKMSRKPVSEQEKFQPSYDCTVFTDCSMDAFALYNLSTSIMNNNDILQQQQQLPKAVCSDGGLNEMQKSKTSNILSPIKTTVGTNDSSSPANNMVSEKPNNSICHMYSDISDISYEFPFSNFQSMSPKQKILTSTASWEETQKWLKDNRFDVYLSTFENFSGSDFLLLSKEDLIQICGLTDGIRLYNALHSKNIKSKLSIYVCSSNDEIFRAIYLDSLTVNELQSKLITTLLQSKCTYFKRFCIMGPSGVKILITDDVIRNIQDESLFIVEFTKDYKGEFHAVMKPYNNIPMINNIHCS